MAQPFMRPQPIVEKNRDARHSAGQMNSAVSRITGMNRAILTPKEELKEQAAPPAQQQQQQQPQQAERRYIPGLTQHDWTEADMQEGTSRANQSNRGPESRAYERGYDGARDNEPRDQKMAKKTAKDRPYGSKDQDDEEDDLETNQRESRHMGDNSMNESSITHVAGLSMEVFREMAGMTPIYDIQESREYYAEAVGQAAQLPTKQATSYTKMSAGYGQQEGGFPQSMKPKEYGSDGADSESTLDQAIGMLKKEGLDADYLWSRFLGENNLSIPILEMLCDEAMETGDEAMAEELMQLEDAFDVFYESALVEAFGPEVAEGILSMFKKKQAVAADAPKKPVGTDVTPAGSGGTSTVNLGARMKQQKPQGKKPLQLRPVGGATPKKAGKGPQIPPHLMPKQKAAAGGGGVQLPPWHPKKGGGAVESRYQQESDSANYECDDDGAGNPRMPWDKQGSLAGLAAKYGGRKNGRTAA